MKTLALEPVQDDRLYAPAEKIYPQAVKGPFRRLKWRLLIVCLGLYYLLPFVRWDRGPHLPNQAVLVDLTNSRFYFFFIELWPQEVYYFTGLLIIAALALFLANSIAGRVWCGYLCPQTVWTDLFLAVEHLVEGDRRERIKLAAAPMSFDKAKRRILKHSLWIMIAWWTGGAWVLYFSDAPTLVRDLATFHAPLAAYLWIGILTFTTYALAGFMREQVCLYMCPWPRIQAALTDQDALNVTYRFDRGEPRMSVKESVKTAAAGLPAGACVDCFQCVAVCPTGIDIRNGSQLGCIQCGLCIDACDTVMAKIGRSSGLIGYDNDDNVERRLAGKPVVSRLIRPRTVLYAAIITLVGAIMVFALATRQMLAISSLHDRSPLYVVLKDGSIRNNYAIRLANKRPYIRGFQLSVEGLPLATIQVADEPAEAIVIGPDQTREVRLLVSMPVDRVTATSVPIRIRITDPRDHETAFASDHFLAP